MDRLTYVTPAMRYRRDYAWVIPAAVGALGAAVVILAVVAVGVLG